MRVTLNEIYRLCQKAAEGAGAPAGLDSETAQATAWLLAHGFPVLQSLAATLENLDEQACRFDGAALNSSVLDASNKAGPLIAPGLVDLLMARASQGLLIRNLESPLYLLPNALRYAPEGRLSIELRLADEARFVLEASPVGTTIYGSAESTMLTSSARFTAVCSAVNQPAADLTDLTGLAVCVDQATLDRAEAHSLANGLRVDPDVWRRLQTLAQKVLVPASESSRRGAGAVASDND